MRTAHLPTVHVLVATTRREYGGGGVGPQVNKFEQVPSDDHQMSVAGGRYPGLMSKGVPYLSIYACDVPSPHSFVCGR